MQSSLKMPLSNLQQELLQLYAHQVSEDDLMNIKELIGKYFALRLSAMADSAWESNNWSQHDMENILNDRNQ
ncbi:hypothetical protein [Dyadobacter sp. Leaf189]|uniref:hypothetical protein n=1 Tax=Dyadobacter sp. Leaf189 TaxID=1736295 RepID=UPI000700FEAC|nr:hypothetical protein [Dyadobacter sp. Leaf189]KQS24836.1 hypothetical protein ASG33_24125 [Dyadobacter sp. Leaf189]